MYQLYNDDCMDFNINIKCDLLILDPPYFSTNIKELGDNNWKTEIEYINWFKSVIDKFINLLKDNGSMYIFHNDLDIMTDILYYIKHNKEMSLRNHIKWNKFPTHNTFSRIIKTYGKNRNYSQTFSEDIYFITKQKDYFDTPFSKIIKYNMTEKNIDNKTITALCPSKTGGMTGWLANKIKGTQIPTKEQWSKICNLFQIKNDYEQLLNEYKNKRYRFNQKQCNFKSMNCNQQKEILKPYSEVWEYNKDKVENFYTTKPIKMMENIVEISTNKGDLVLDPFMGSGTTGVACLNTNRDFIGIEIDKNYHDIAKQRIENAENTK